MCIANILHGLVPKRVKKLHLNTFELEQDLDFS